ncbi:NADH-quinone oxidoreductase subunit NuoE [Clostridium sp. 'deep sea']|uniref:NADH-quinone oxidoreductase subunit NuoE n=1 Tax=Clostridium sp. 'deep sea' TaxID=2779445 RepID=UPI0018969CFA|nr:NADH-quinone oxidoreductase subunit NuoE [Clostridium sp. 'deep sea']QOR36367.1 NADH-quinone oxidoreductase subunit NuoE [Clostridium sp. 'deep sea']
MSKLSADHVKQIDKIIEEFKDQKGSLIPVLQKVQNIFGYLPEEAQKHVAYGLNVPVADVYGVITFYSLFHTEPTGKYIIELCMGTACYVKGAVDVQHEIENLLSIKVNETTEDGKFTLRFSRCVGACSLAPFMTIGEDVYGRVKQEDVQRILSKYF